MKANETVQDNDTVTSKLRRFAYTYKSRLYKTAGVTIGKIALFLLRQRYQAGPIPFQTLLRIRNLMPSPIITNPFFRALKTYTSTGETLNNPALAAMLASTELGDISVPADTMNALEAFIQAHKPNVILEFGSGISTLCFAHYMRQVKGAAGQVYVISIEQESRYAEQTRQRLRQFDLDRYVTVLHAPVSEQVIDGVTGMYYTLDMALLSEALGPRKIDMILVDGPHGLGTTRYGTLPFLQPVLAPQARFYLDDAFRDPELTVARLWSEHLPVEIAGVYPVGKGLLAGNFTR